MANIALHVPKRCPCESQAQSPGKGAILPVVSPKCTARVLVHRYVTTIHTRGGADTVDLFDDHNRCLVSRTVRVPTCTKDQAGYTSGQLYRFYTIESSSLASLHTMQIRLILVDTERLSRLTPATMGILRHILTFPTQPVNGVIRYPNEHQQSHAKLLLQLAASA